MLLILGAFSAGYLIASQIARYNTSVPHATPLIESASRVIDGMSDEEAREFVQKVKSYGSSLDRDQDLAVFHKAFQAYLVLSLMGTDLPSPNGARTALECSLANFAQVYDAGNLAVGEFNPAADALRENYAAYLLRSGMSSEE